LSDAESRFRERGNLEELPGDSPYLRELLLALRQSLKSEVPITFREGAGLVLDQQEADDPEFVRRALGAMDSPPEGPLTPPGRINIQVGEIEGLALVQAGFAQGMLRGEVSLVGPLRMRYRKAI
jgi:heat-inducible transcriptional repressor